MDAPVISQKPAQKSPMTIQKAMSSNMSRDAPELAGILIPHNCRPRISHAPAWVESC
jgi:hypothetical protein